MGIQLARMLSPETLMLTFPCPHCQTLLSADPDKAGSLLTCPKCQATVLVPLAPEGSQWSDLLAPAEAEGEIGRLGGYRVLGLLGNGGMGVVLRAEDPTLGREIALKIMLPHLAGPSHRKRFLREAKSAAVVEHEHVVTIYQVGEDRGVPFIAMQLLRGESLEARLLRERKMGVVEAARIGREIALGLAAAHEKGIVHRDVKPGNVWLEKNTNKVKLLDFGLARESSPSSQLTTSPGPMGTPAFMAPEQVQGKVIDARADLFALGCVLYRALTGRLAFSGADPFTTMMAVVSHDPPTPASLCPNVPKEISELVMRLLAKRPEDRPPSAAEVAQTLAGTDANLQWPTTVDTDRPPTDPTLSAVEARAKQGQARRGRRLVLAVYVVLALAVAGTFVGLLIASAAQGWQVAGGGVIQRTPNGNEPVPNETDEQREDKGKTPEKEAVKDSPAKEDDKNKEKAGKKKVVPDKQPKTLVIEDENRGFRLELMLIPATGEGGFFMGSTEEERRQVLEELGEKEEPTWLKAESPRHKVVLTKDFYLGKFEVTQQQYQTLMGTNPSFFSSDGRGKNTVKDLDTGDFPVENVSWEEAQAFMKKLADLPSAKKLKGTFRLPTEAEWEYACRAGADVKEPFTFALPSASLSSAQANFDGTFPFGGGQKGARLRRTCKVGSYDANPFGLHDLHGNVSEWCQDCYEENAYASKERRDPTGPKKQDADRVIRGGTWYDKGRLCRSASRSKGAPALQVHVLGFRVAFVPSDTAR